MAEHGESCRSGSGFEMWDRLMTRNRLGKLQLCVVALGELMVNYDTNIWLCSYWIPACSGFTFACKQIFSRHLFIYLFHQNEDFFVNFHHSFMLRNARQYVGYSALLLETYSFRCDSFLEIIHIFHIAYLEALVNFSNLLRLTLEWNSGFCSRRLNRFLFSWPLGEILRGFKLPLSRFLKTTFANASRFWNTDRFPLTCSCANVDVISPMFAMEDNEFLT